nr:dammarenediol 12-hydroxylase-like [Coffea arabica]
MEQSGILWLLFPLLFSLYLCLHKLTLTYKSCRFRPFGSEKPRLPPGRTGLPLLGESLDYLFKVKQAIPRMFVEERMNKYSSKIFPTSWIVEPMAILLVLRGTNFSSLTREMIRKGDGLRENVEFMDEVMKQHVQSDRENKVQVTADDMANRYVLTLACKIFLGINDPGKIDELAEGMKEIVNRLHSMPINFPGTAASRGIKASKLMHRAVKAMDFMSRMLLATDDNGHFFSETDIASHLVGLVQEQKEIADSKEAKDKRSWEDLRKTKYSWKIVREALKLMPPGIGSFREVLTDFTYEGYTIPKGWKNIFLILKILIYDLTEMIQFLVHLFHSGEDLECALGILIFKHNIVNKFRWEKLIPNEKVAYNLVPKLAQGLPIRVHPHKP